MQLANVTHLYIDNNFFWCLAKDKIGSKIQKFNESLIQFNIVSQPQQVTIICSPFTLLESIALSKIPCPKITPPENLLQKDKIEELKFFLVENAFTFFSQQEKLNPDFLINAVKDQLKFGSPIFGKQLYADVIAKNVEVVGFEKRIYQSLALDYMHKFNYPKHLAKVASQSFVADILRSTCLGHNASQARLIHKAYREVLAPSLLKDGTLSKDDHKKILRNDYCFKMNSDLMDTELTHIATVGWGEEGSQYSTVCFTIDPASKVKFRLFIYKTLATIAYETIKNEEDKRKLPFDYVEMKSGIVCVCSNKTGEILERIDVEKVLSFTDLDID